MTRRFTPRSGACMVACAALACSGLSASHADREASRAYAEYSARLDALERSRPAYAHSRQSASSNSAELNAVRASVYTDARLRATSELDQLRVRIAKLEKLVAYAFAKIEFLECSLVKQRVLVRTEEIKSSCNKAISEQQQCEAKRAEARATGTVMGALVGCLGTLALAGADGGTLCALGSSAGWAAGEFSQTCDASAPTELTCPQDPQRVALKDEGLEVPPKCVEPTRPPELLASALRRP